MSYYKEVKKANKLIDETIKEVLLGKETTIDQLILEVTAKHEVGDKVVVKRVNRILAVNKDLGLDEEGKLFLRV